jgi:hypothetical protein
MSAQPETRAPLVDALELLGLFVIPALLVGFVLSVVSGTDALVAGLVIGGLFGAILAGLRNGFYAVRTAEGIERRLRSPPDDSDNVWVRLANIEYDPKYDRLLALLLFVVGVGSFAAIPFVDPQNGPLILRLVLVGLFGLTTALMMYGVRRA